MCLGRQGRAVSGRQAPSHTFVNSRFAGIGQRHGRRSVAGRRADPDLLQTRQQNEPFCPPRPESTALEMTQPLAGTALRFRLNPPHSSCRQRKPFDFFS